MAVVKHETPFFTGRVLAVGCEPDESHALAFQSGADALERLGDSAGA